MDECGKKSPSTSRFSLVACSCNTCPEAVGSTFHPFSWGVMEHTVIAHLDLMKKPCSLSGNQVHPGVLRAAQLGSPVLVTALLLMCLSYLPPTIHLLLPLTWFFSSNSSQTKQCFSFAASVTVVLGSLFQRWFQFCVTVSATDLLDHTFPCNTIVKGSRQYLATQI